MPEEPIDPEVVPPGKESPAGDALPAGKVRTFYHPLSGVVILGVDWIAFGLELPMEFLDVPAVSLLSFAFTFWAVSRIQLRDGDDPHRARLKALVGAIAAAIPLPITGTMVGGAILYLSGLSRLMKFPSLPKKS